MIRHGNIHLAVIVHVGEIHATTTVWLAGEALRSGPPVTLTVGDENPRPICET
jgi:hypothetical protein